MHVLITGAAGQIGKEIVAELSSAHELCLLDRRPVPDKQSIVADLAQAGASTGWRRWFKPRFAQWANHFAEVDTVLHLAANVNPSAPWPLVLRDNIQATWNVFEAAVQHQVRRVIFASSNWAVKALEQTLAPACYLPDGPKIGSDAPPSPISPYGVSKAFGELSGRMLVDERRLSSFIAVRIGSYRLTPPQDETTRQRWIGASDLRSLLRRCVETELEGFHVVYGVSAQPSAPYNLSYTRRLLSWEPRQLL
jgi:NAD+ dependent glucose-6-phosphate dehydrogenase